MQSSTTFIKNAYSLTLQKFIQLYRLQVFNFGNVLFSNFLNKVYKIKIMNPAEKTSFWSHFETTYGSS